jgi:hypothetical protein
MLARAPTPIGVDLQERTLRELHACTRSGLQQDGDDLGRG